jgi:hypothetical protein
MPEHDTGRRRYPPSDEARQQIANEHGGRQQRQLAEVELVRAGLMTRRLDDADLEGLGILERLRRYARSDCFVPAALPISSASQWD